MARELPAGVCANTRITAHIFGRDHRPSHFHVVNRDIWTCRVSIETGETLEGERFLTAKERDEIEAYRLRHLELLRATWRKKHGPDR
jgi:hypothetical protein